MTDYKDLYLKNKLKYINLKNNLIYGSGRRKKKPSQGALSLRSLTNKEGYNYKYTEIESILSKYKKNKTKTEVRPIYGNKYTLENDNIKKNYESIQSIPQLQRTDIKKILFQIDKTLELVANSNRIACTVYSGNPINTCGYTAPTIIILLYYFYINGIDSNLKYNRIKDTLNDDFFVKINTVVQFFYDNNNAYGMGHIHEIQQRGLSSFYTLIVVPHLNGIADRDNFLQVGPNLISFMHRSNNITIHHSCIFVLENDDCLIMDSWFDNRSRQSRPITIRPDTYKKNEILDVLTFISRETHRETHRETVQEQKKEYFLKYFMAPKTMNLITTNVIAISVKHKIIKDIFELVFE